MQLKRQGEPADAAARDRDTQRRGVGSSCWCGGPPKGRFVANICTASAEHAGSVQSTGPSRAWLGALELAHIISLARYIIIRIDIYSPAVAVLAFLPSFRG